MNTNVSKSSSLYGKMMAILVVALFALSSFTAMVSASDDGDEESEITTGITLGEALVSESEGEISVVSEFNPAPLDEQELPIAITMAEGKFSPARQDPGGDFMIERRQIRNLDNVAIVRSNRNRAFY